MSSSDTELNALRDAMDLKALREAMEERDRGAATVQRRIVVGLLLGAIALMLLWFSGRVDPFLSQVGLNKNACITNGFGATFCGDDAAAYEQKVLGAAAYEQKVLSATPSAGFSTRAARNAAQANVRAAVPSAEAYYSDHGGYAGMTTEKLRQYDYALPEVTVASTAQAYCLEATVGTETFSVSRPGGSVVPRPC